MKPPFDPKQTLEYYDRNAAEFINSTVGVDMSAMYDPFLRQIPNHGRILDVGCGSGRDSLAFIQLGYDVVSIDGSGTMVEATSNLTGRPAVLMRFDEIDFDSEFDGIWACASLLHVPRLHFSGVLQTLERALRPGGILFVSVKRGTQEYWRNGRFFSDYDESSVLKGISSGSGLEVLKLWTTRDARPERQSEHWTNVLAQRAIKPSIPQLS